MTDSAGGAGAYPPPGGMPAPGGMPPGTMPPAPGASPPASGAAPHAPQPGSPPPWQQLPPEQLARMHQPGVIPLRPLFLGDIFGGSLQTMRRNPEATIGMGFIVMAVLLVPSLLASLLLGRIFTTLPEMDLLTITLLVNFLLSMLSSIALTGMIVHVVGEAVLGDRSGLGETWRAVRGRLPALVGNVLLITLLGLVAIGIAVGLVVLAVLALEGAGGGTSVLIGVLVLLLALGLTVGGIWAGCRVSLAPAPVVLEKAGPWRGITRSWSLTTGWQAWRVVGITLLAGLLTGIFSTMVQTPISFITMIGLESTGATFTPVSPVVLTVDHLLQLLVGALTVPFTAGVTALLYLDQRIRREGLDVSLLRAAQDRAAARQRRP